LGEGSGGDADSLYQGVGHGTAEVMGLARQLEMSQAAVDVMDSMRDGWMGGMGTGMGKRAKAGHGDDRRSSLGGGSTGGASTVGGQGRDGITGLEASFASGRTATAGVENRPGYVDGVPLSARRGYFEQKYGR